MPPPSHPLNWRVERWSYEDERGNRGEVATPRDPAPVPTPIDPARHHEEILRRLDRIENFYRGQQEAEVMRTLLMNLGDPYHRAGEQISEELIAASPLLQLFVRRMQEYGFVRRLRAGVVTIMPPVNEAVPPFERRRVMESRVPDAIHPNRNDDVLDPDLARQIPEEAMLLRRMSDPIDDVHHVELVHGPPGTPEVERSIPEEIGDGEEL